MHRPRRSWPAGRMVDAIMNGRAPSRGHPESALSQPLERSALNEPLVTTRTKRGRPQAHFTCGSSSRLGPVTPMGTAPESGVARELSLSRPLLPRSSAAPSTFKVGLRTRRVEETLSKRQPRGRASARGAGVARWRRRTDGAAAAGGVMLLCDVRRAGLTWGTWCRGRARREDETEDTSPCLAQRAGAPSRPVGPTPPGTEYDDT